MPIKTIGGLYISPYGDGGEKLRATPRPAPYFDSGSFMIAIDSDPTDESSLRIIQPSGSGNPDLSANKLQVYFSGSGKLGFKTTDPKDDIDFKADSIKFRSDDGTRELEFTEGRLIPKKFANSTDVETSGSEVVLAYSPGTFESTSVARTNDILGTVSWEDLSIARKGDATALRIQGKVDGVAIDGSAIKGSMRFGIGSSVAGQEIKDVLILSEGGSTFQNIVNISGSTTALQIGATTEDADRRIILNNTTTAKKYVMGVDESRGLFVIHQGATAFPGSSEDFAMDNGGNIELAQNLTVGGNIQAFTLGGKLTGGSSEIEGSNFDITGGSISGCDITIGEGKTLELREASAVNLSTALARSIVSAADGAAIDNCIIGGTTAAAGTFTNLTATGNSVLGNASTDTHTITGNITASGAISSSGAITSGDGSGNEFTVRPNLYFFATNTSATVEGNDAEGSLPATNTTTVTLTQEQNSHTGVFSLSSNRLTISRAGLYKMSFNMTTELNNGSGRAESFVGLVQETSGGTVSLVDGTEGRGYHRFVAGGSAAASGQSYSANVIVDVAANSIYDLRFGLHNIDIAGQKLRTIDEGTSFLVEAIT